jgi:hypothetical protein
LNGASPLKMPNAVALFTRKAINFFQKKLMASNN